jgi:hypothetical protein
MPPALAGESRKTRQGLPWPLLAFASVWEIITKEPRSFILAPESMPELK